MCVWELMQRLAKGVFERADAIGEATGALLVSDRWLHPGAVCLCVDEVNSQGRKSKSCLFLSEGFSGFEALISLPITRIHLDHNPSQSQAHTDSLTAPASQTRLMERR